MWEWEFTLITANIISSPLQSTAGHRGAGLSNLSRSSGTRTQLLLTVMHKSSLDDLAWGRPTQLLPRRGLHSRTRLPQQLAVLRLTWAIRCGMTVNLDHYLDRFRIRSCRAPPSIALSLALWATLNLWTSRGMSVHVSNNNCKQLHTTDCI
jgi:hypothetical protein